jgi:hypothetical protein
MKHATEPHGAGPSCAGAGRTESESERSPQTLRISTESVLQGLGRSRADQVRVWLGHTPNCTEPAPGGPEPGGPSPTQSLRRSGPQALRISAEPDLHKAGAGQTEAAAAAAAATAVAASSKQQQLA